MAQELIQRPRLRGIIGQTAVLGIAFQQPLALQKSPDTVSDGVRQLGEFGARRRLGPLEPDARSIGAIDVDTSLRSYSRTAENARNFRRK